MGTQISPKNPKIFSCVVCDFISSNKKDYGRHLSTLKHKNRQKDTNDTKKPQQKPQTCYECVICNKSYKYSSGLYRHKKRCISDENIHINSNEILNNQLALSKELIMNVVKEQQNQIKELTDTIKELIPRVGNNITTTNQKFNIQVFLNEKCKNAINMNDFIKQIKLTLEDLDLTKNKGLEIGLTNAIIQTISKLSLFERPLHCTDPKRETLYIKDNDLWEKDSDKTKIKRALHNLNKAHFKLIQDWIAENPDFKENDAKQDYFAYLLKTCSVNLKTIDDKIIKKICASNNLKTNLKEFENINYD